MRFLWEDVKHDSDGMKYEILWKVLGGSDGNFQQVNMVNYPLVMTNIAMENYHF